MSEEPLEPLEPLEPFERFMFLSAAPARGEDGEEAVLLIFRSSEHTVRFLLPLKHALDMCANVIGIAADEFGDRVALKVKARYLKWSEAEEDPGEDSPVGS